MTFCPLDTDIYFIFIYIISCTDGDGGTDGDSKIFFSESITKQKLHVLHRVSADCYDFFSREVS